MGSGTATEAWSCVLVALLLPEAAKRRDIVVEQAAPQTTSSPADHFFV